jgi:outer membrane protein assembly factor BamB
MVAGEGVIESPTIADDGTMYVLTKKNHLLALDTNGRIKWRFKSRPYEQFCEGIQVGWLAGPAVAADGTVYVAGFELYALTADGTVKWTYDYGQDDPAPAPPTVGGDGTVYVALAFADSVCPDLHAVSPTGKRVWNGFYSDGVTTVVVGRDRSVYVNSDFGILAVGEKTRKR